MSRLTLRHLLICLVLAGLYGPSCTPVMTKAPEFPKAPSTFESSADTNSIGSLPWKQYFKDSVLVQLIEIGIQQNPDVRMAIQRMQMAKAQVRYAKGAYLPAAQLSTGASRRKFGRYTMDGAGNSTTEITPGQIVPVDLPDYYAGFQAAWEVDVWGKLRNRKKSAQYRYLASEEGKNWVLSNLIADISTLYYELLALKSERNLVLRSIRLQENALSIVKIQKDAGHANELAVKQFEAQVFNSRAIEMDLEQRIIETENQLNLLLGRYSQPIPLNDQYFLTLIPDALSHGVPSSLLQNRPDVREAMYQLKANQADLKAARAAFYPSFMITGSYGFQAFDTKFLLQHPESMAYGLFGGLALPLVNRNAIKAEFRTADAARVEALYQYQKTLLLSFAEVRNQLASMRNLDSIYVLKEKEVAVLTHAIETSTELFKTGRASYLEVLMSQRSALIANIELVETRKKRFDATVYLYKALGGGWR
ncbi:MAG: efflux transporter outer membrane subunit [Cytophagaceae bacterium]|nr:efflux transporter outer membrane subunit [Cytophagaceae bacterium]